MTDQPHYKPGRFTGHTPGGHADSAGQSWTGRLLQPNPFAGDTGETEPEVAAALGETDPTTKMTALVRALRTARLLAPVVAHEHPGREDDGSVTVHEKYDQHASASMVTVATADGRSATPVFSSVADLAAWDKTARPVPAEGPRAALAAVQEADALMVLNPATGPILIGRPATIALAQSQPWAPPWHDDELTSTIATAMRGISHLAGVRLEHGQRAEVKVVLAVKPGLDRAGLTDVVTRVSTALEKTTRVRERIDSLEIYPTLVE